MRLTRCFLIFLGLLWLTPACAQLTLPGVLRQPSPSKCEWAHVGLEPSAFFIGKKEVTVDARGAVRIWMVRAGNRIAMHTGIEPSEKVSVELTAKISETSDVFSEMCKRRRVTSYTAGGAMRANAPLGSADVLWRIEVRSGAVSGRKKQRPLTLTIWDVSTVRDDNAWKQGIGLNHIDKGPSLMSSSMEGSRCIDRQTVDSLLAQDDQPSKAKLPQTFTMTRRGSLW